MSRLLCVISSLLMGLILSPVPAQADTVVLKDGTVREGTIVAEDDGTVTMEVRMGGLKGKIVIQRYEIASLKTQPLPPDPVEVEAAKLHKQAEGLRGREAADAWVQLGDLYARHTGYSAQAKAAYEKAIGADPDHAKARHGLGHVKTAEGWQKTDDLRRERGLVPLGQVWVKPDERSWLIDRRHEEQTEELRIGPRQADTFSKAEVERNLALKRAEDEAKQYEASLLANGNSLLSQYGYYTHGSPYYIGAGSGWADGVGVEGPGYSFFAGTVGTGWYPYGGGCAPYYGPHGGGWGAMYGGKTKDFKKAYGYSPGFKWGNFSFGTSFGGYGGCGGYGGYRSGWGLNLRGGSSSVRWNLNMGGFSGSSSFRSSTGFGFFGF